MSQIPKASATDTEDVVWALQTADALWKRGEYTDSIAWLRRAAQAAGEAEDDERALALAHYAAELAEWLDAKQQRIESTREDYESTVVEISVTGDAHVTDPDADDMRDPADSKLPSFEIEAIRDEDATTTAVAPKSIYEAAAASEAPEEILSIAPEDLAADEGDETMAAPKPAIPKPPPIPQQAPPRRSVAAVQGPPVPQVAGEAVPARVPVPFDPPDTDLHVPNPDDTGLQHAQPASVRSEAAPSPVVPPPRQQFPTAPYNSSVPLPNEIAEEVAEARQASARASQAAPANHANQANEASKVLLDLDGVEAFADLPDDERIAFARKAQIVELVEGAEVPFSALAYIVSGDVEACASVADAPAMTLKAGEVLRNRGTIDATIALRLIASSESAKVACWPADEVEAAFRACSWVEDDLRERANRILAMCGVGVGVLGERLDAELRQQVVDRMEIKVFESGETIVEKGKPVPGLLLVGFGDVELDGGATASCGDFLYQEAALGAGAAGVASRAGKSGVVLLTATRSVTQELLATCPPLVEILAGF